jgi:hypothetical protein
VNEENGNLKRELILGAAQDITKYLKEKYDVEDVNLDCDIAWFINNQIGFIFNAIEQVAKEK